MLENVHFKFLMANNVIENIINFINEKDFKNVRLCHSPPADLQGKIVLLVSYPKRCDDYDQLTCQHKLRTTVNNDDIVLLFEEDIKEGYKAEIIGQSVPFNKNNIRKLYHEQQGYHCDITHKEEGDIFEMNIVIKIKKSRLTDKQSLIKHLKQELSTIVESHILPVGIHKRPFHHS